MKNLMQNHILNLQINNFDFFLFGPTNIQMFSLPCKDLANKFEVLKVRSDGRAVIVKPNPCSCLERDWWAYEVCNAGI